MSKKRMGASLLGLAGLVALTPGYLIARDMPMEALVIGVPLALICLPMMWLFFRTASAD